MTPVSLRRWQTGEILDGVWRFEQPHPEWDTSDDDWPQDVAWWALLTGAGVVLIDPLVNDWTALDGLLRAHNGCAAVVRTCYWHHRSVDQPATRYHVGVWALPAPTPPQRRCDHPIASGSWLPGGLTAYAVGRFDEVAVWFPDQAALFFGDVALRTETGQATLCPESWLAPLDGARQVRRALNPMLDLPVEHVLVSHGPPVIGDGRRALESVLRI